MENTSAEKSVRQLLFRIGGNYHNGAVLCLDGAFRLMDIKLHLVKLPEKVVGKFQICLVDFVNQKHHLLFGLESLAQLSKLDVAGNIIHALFPELSVIEPLDSVVHVKTVLRLGCRFDIPDYQLLPEGFGNRLRQHGFAGSRLSLDKKGLFQGNGNVYACH